MGKNEETFSQVGRLIIGLFMVFAGIAIMFLPFVLMREQMISIVLAVSALTFLFGGLFVHLGIGNMANENLEKSDSYFTNDDGKTMHQTYWPAATKNHLMRKAIFGFAEAILFCILAIASIVFAFIATEQLTYLLIIAVVCLIVAVIMFFVVGKDALAEHKKIIDEENNDQSKEDK